LQCRVFGIGVHVLHCYVRGIRDIKGWWLYLISSLLGLVIVAITVMLERKVLRGLQLRTGPIVVG